MKRLILALSALLTSASAIAQPIMLVPNRPPETVQRVAIPVDPKEERIKLLIILGQNSCEHDWTGGEQPDPQAVPGHRPF